MASNALQQFAEAAHAAAVNSKDAVMATISGNPRGCHTGRIRPWGPEGFAGCSGAGIPRFAAPA